MDYRTAIEELENILEDLRNQQVGVDELETSVARAAELVDWCRTRLRTVADKTDRLDTGVEPGQLI